MEFVIISSMSGAGKSRAAKFLGYYTVDNISPSLILRFTQQCLKVQERYQYIGESRQEPVALVDRIDRRHRSVTVTHSLTRHLGRRAFPISTHHRDIS